MTNSFHVLHLFAHLLDQDLELHRDIGRIRHHRFRTQRVGLTIQLLHQKIQPPPDRLATANHPAYFINVIGQPVKLFVDVNLREPWWRAEDFPWLLRRARWVKINDEELEIVANTIGRSGHDLAEKARRVQESFDIELLIVTRGAKGARALPAGAEPVDVAPAPAQDVVDTVGAGDAFASIMILGLTSAWPLDTTLQRAQEFASAVVGQRGATVGDRGFYQGFIDSWQL